MSLFIRVRFAFILHILDSVLDVPLVVPACIFLLSLYDATNNKQKHNTTLTVNTSLCPAQLDRIKLEKSNINWRRQTGQTKWW